MLVVFWIDDEEVVCEGVVVRFVLYGGNVGVFVVVEYVVDFVECCVLVCFVVDFFVVIDVRELFDVDDWNVVIEFEV